MTVQFLTLHAFVPGLYVPASTGELIEEPASVPSEAAAGQGEGAERLGNREVDLRPSPVAPPINETAPISGDAGENPELKGDQDASLNISDIGIPISSEGADAIEPEAPSQIVTSDAGVPQASEARLTKQETGNPAASETASADLLMNGKLPDPSHNSVSASPTAETGLAIGLIPSAALASPTDFPDMPSFLDRRRVAA